MKTNVNIFNNLNESFNKQVEVKKKVLMEGNKVTIKEAALSEEEQIKNLKLMDDVMIHLNDNEFIEIWLANGVPDSATEEDFVEIVHDDEINYDYMLGLFKEILHNATKESVEGNEPTFYDCPEETLAFAKEFEPEVTNYIPEEETEVVEESSIEEIKDKVKEIQDKEKAEYEEITTKPEDFKKNKSTELKEEDIVTVPSSEVEPDYIINDVTVLNQTNDGDVQAPDIDALLTLVNENLKVNYGHNWGTINTFFSKVNEGSSYALVDITTPEILKEFENRGISDIAIGKNLILENTDNGLVTFKVNALNGTNRYTKNTSDPVATIVEWVESEFLNEAKAEKEAKLEALRIKTEKETIDNYIETHSDIKLKVEEIKMFIEMSKSIKDEAFINMLQNKIYAFAVEFPMNIEITNKEDKYELKFNNVDEVVEHIFGKDWVKETETPEVVELKESATYVIYVTTGEDGVYNSHEYCRVDNADQASDIVAELQAQGLGASYDVEEDLKESVEESNAILQDLIKFLEDNGINKANIEENSAKIEEYLEANQLGMKAYIPGVYVVAKFDGDNKTTLGRIVCYSNGKWGSTASEITLESEKRLNESYEQFNIGNIEVVFNPETYETLYSIPSADVKDKKINLTKIPSVDTPYDTNTIIKQYIETRFGVIPTEEEKKAIDNQEKETPAEVPMEVPTEEIPVDIEVPEEAQIEEDSLPAELETNDLEVGVDIDNMEQEDSLPAAETGNAVFVKIRPKQQVDIRSIRERLMDVDTPETAYIIVDTIDLSSEDWNNMLSDLTANQSFLANVKPIDRKNYSFNVVKVTCAESDFALLIDPLGYSYPRYIAIAE